MRKSGAFRSLVSLALIVLAIGFSGAVFSMLARLKKPAAEREAVERIYTVEVFNVETSDMLPLISAYGTARSDREVVISAQVTGIVVDIHDDLKVGLAVKGPSVGAPTYGEPAEMAGAALSPFGGPAEALLETIHLGDLMVRIDPRTYIERVRQARNRLVEDSVLLKQLEQEEKNNARLLTRAEADFETFKKEVDRIKDLRRRNSATDSQIANAEIQLRGFEMSVLKLEDQQVLFPIRRDQVEEQRITHQAELDLAELDLVATEVRPAFSGLLSEVFVEQGQLVRTGDPLVRVTDVSKVEIPLSVRVEDYSRIEPLVRSGEGAIVEFSESTTGETKWHGRIVRVSPEVDEMTRTVMVYAIVDNRDEQNRSMAPLLSGTFVHARIHAPIIRQIQIVPRDAILRGGLYVISNIEDVEDDGSDKAKKRGRVERRSIKVVRNFGSLSAVETSTTGIDRLAGDEPVVLTNLDVINTDSKVEWVVEDSKDLRQEIGAQEVKLIDIVDVTDAATGTDPSADGTH